MDPSLRAVFADQETAEAVARRLARDGFEARVLREPFAGDDDDEDHASAVLTDAPAGLLELVVDAHDGWLEYPDSGVTPTAPLALPTAPIRIKGPDPDGTA